MEWMACSKWLIQSVGFWSNLDVQEISIKVQKLDFWDKWTFEIILIFWPCGQKTAQIPLAFQNVATCSQMVTSITAGNFRRNLTMEYNTFNVLVRPLVKIFSVSMIMCGCSLSENKTQKKLKAHCLSNVRNNYGNWSKTLHIWRKSQQPQKRLKFKNIKSVRLAIKLYVKMKGDRQTWRFLFIKDISDNLVPLPSCYCRFHF